MATTETEARIHREKLYKFLTKDCKDALEKINGEADSELSRELSHFIEKYGTQWYLGVHMATEWRRQRYGM